MSLKENLKKLNPIFLGSASFRGWDIPYFPGEKVFIVTNTRGKYDVCLECTVISYLTKDRTEVEPCVVVRVETHVDNYLSFADGMFDFIAHSEEDMEDMIATHVKKRSDRNKEISAQIQAIRETFNK